MDVLEVELDPISVSDGWKGSFFFKVSQKEQGALLDSFDLDLRADDRNRIASVQKASGQLVLLVAAEQTAAAVFVESDLEN